MIQILTLNSWGSSALECTALYCWGPTCLQIFQQYLIGQRCYNEKSFQKDFTVWAFSNCCILDVNIDTPNPTSGNIQTTFTSIMENLTKFILADKSFSLSIPDISGKEWQSWSMLDQMKYLMQVGSIIRVKKKKRAGVLMNVCWMGKQWLLKPPPLPLQGCGYNLTALLIEMAVRKNKCEVT